MGTRDQMWRTIGWRLALLGVVFYATFVPWHAAQRHAALSVLAEIDAATHASFCNGGVSAPAAPGQPANQPSDCPICQGMAAAALAILPVAAKLPAPASELAVPTLALDQRADGSLPQQPRNRGPPRLA